MSGLSSSIHLLKNIILNLRSFIYEPNGLRDGYDHGFHISGTLPSKIYLAAASWSDESRIVPSSPLRIESKDSVIISLNLLKRASS